MPAGCRDATCGASAIPATEAQRIPSDARQPGHSRDRAARRPTVDPRGPGCLRCFDEFQQELGIATNILSARLELLVGQKILTRRLYVRHPPRYEYRLTPKGHDLFHCAVVLNARGDCWLAPSAGPAYHLVHRACGRVITPLVRCSHCHAALLPDAVTNARRLRMSL